MSRIVETVYAFLFSAIAGGELRPGAHLIEESIACQLGVSRTPVREAIRRLEAEGLVVLTRNAGASVVLLSEAEIAETFRLRAMLEGDAAARAARLATPAQLDRLDQLAQRMAALFAGRPPPDQLAVGRLNTEFHLALAEAAASARLLALIRSLVHLPLAIMHQQGWARQLGQTRGHDEQIRIVAALRAADPDLARALMQMHVLGARPLAPQ